MMRPLLLIMNPRRIKRCVDAIAALDIDKVWMVAMTERQLEPVCEDIVAKAEALGYTHALLLSDDTVPTQAALDLVLRHLPAHPCVTAYCNLDSAKPEVNLTSRPFANLEASYGPDYSFMTRAEVEAHPAELVPTFFGGACLTGMSIEMWRTYPFRVFGEGAGYASDWMLATRLQRDGVPIVAPRGAFIEHVKEQWSARDKDPEKRLLVGVIPRDVVWDVRERPNILPGSIQSLRVKGRVTV